jgi:TetR/AcrR family transcriptional regulator, mexJK operon transcriptional repressor
MGSAAGPFEIVSPVRKPRQPARKRAAGRPTHDDATALHARILDAALDEFLAHGFGAASIEGIARAARVNKDTLYRRFGTKEALYRDSVRRAQVTMGQSMSADLFAHPLDVDATLAAVMRHLHLTFTTPQARRIVSMTVTQAALFPDLAKAAQAETREYLEPLERYLAGLQQSGMLEFDDAHEAAHLLATVALGGVRFLFERSLAGAELDAFVQRRLAVLLRGWNHRPPRPAARKRR